MRHLSAALATFAVAGFLFSGTAHAVSKIDAPVTGSTVELAAGKKKEGPGLCGTMKYWDKKTRKCADATQKK